jgi:hypothetical protein
MNRRGWDPAAAVWLICTGDEQGVGVVSERLESVVPPSEPIGEGNEESIRRRTGFWLGLLAS